MVPCPKWVGRTNSAIIGAAKVIPSDSEECPLWSKKGARIVLTKNKNTGEYKHKRVFDTP
jgi:hypothetical protein